MLLSRKLLRKVTSIKVNKVSRCFFQNSASKYSQSMKVAILGAAGKTGNCSSLLLKQSPFIDELALYDVNSLRDVALELSHIDTKCRISSHESGETGLKHALSDAKIVLITAGKSMKCKSPYEEILKTNAEILTDLIPSVIKYSPRAMVAITTSPVNSLVPVTVEMYKKAGILDYARIFGVTTLDCMRANSFAAEFLDFPPECVTVPVIGGGCPETCVPVFSQMVPNIRFTQEELVNLDCAVKNAAFQVEKNYAKTEPLSLSMGFAAARFCASLCKAIKDYPEVTECAYVRSCSLPGVTYLAEPLRLGPNGVQRHLGIPPLSEREGKMLQGILRPLKKAIKMGERLALGFETSSETCTAHSCVTSVARL